MAELRKWDREPAKGCGSLEAAGDLREGPATAAGKAGAKTLPGAPLRLLLPAQPLSRAIWALVDSGEPASLQSAESLGVGRGPLLDSQERSSEKPPCFLPCPWQCSGARLPAGFHAVQKENGHRLVRSVVGRLLDCTWRNHTTHPAGGRAGLLNNPRPATVDLRVCLGLTTLAC